MTTATLSGGPPGTIDVEVSDPTGHQQVLLQGIAATTTAQEVTMMAIASMQLPPNVQWDIRDEGSSRLLSEDQPIGEVARETAPHVRVQLQPDAGLA